MIIGIGSDILDCRRMEKVRKRHPMRLAEKLLSPTELAHWQRLSSPQASSNYLAKRWAAKEALGKACGCGMRAPVLFAHITLTKDGLGKPQITTHAPLTAWLLTRHINHIHVTLSDEPPYCLAFVVLEKAP